MNEIWHLQASNWHIYQLNQQSIAPSPNLVSIQLQRSNRGTSNNSRTPHLVPLLTVIDELWTKGLLLSLRQLNTVFNSDSLAPGTMFPQNSAWVVDTKDGDSTSHWQALENPEEPLMAERIGVHTSSKLCHAKDTANLLS